MSAPTESNCEPPFVPPAHDLRSARLRDFQGKADLPGVLSTFASPIHGIASALIPENPTAAENVTRAVFQLFLERGRKLPQRRLAAVWFFQTALIAAKMERN